jgi:hypothetical protein
MSAQRSEVFEKAPISERHNWSIRGTPDQQASSILD